jgi:hypothetical protein
MAKQKPAPGSDGQSAGRPAQRVKARPKKKKKSNAIIYVLMFLILLLLGVTVVGVIVLVSDGGSVEREIDEADLSVLADDPAGAADKLRTIESQNPETISAEQVERINLRLAVLGEWQSLWGQWKSSEDNANPQDVIASIKGLQTRLPEYGDFFQKKVSEIETTVERKMREQLDAARGHASAGSHEVARMIFDGLIRKYPENPTIRQNIEQTVQQSVDAKLTDAANRARSSEYEMAQLAVADARSLASGYAAYFTQPQEVQRRIDELGQQVAQDAALVAEAQRVLNMPPGEGRNEAAMAVASRSLALEGDAPRTMVQRVAQIAAPPTPTALPTEPPLAAEAEPTLAAEAGPGAEATPQATAPAEDAVPTPDLTAAAVDEPTPAAAGPRELMLQVSVEAGGQGIVRAAVLVDGVEVGRTRADGTLLHTVQAAPGQELSVAVRHEDYSFVPAATALVVGEDEVYPIAFQGTAVEVPTEVPPTSTAVPPTSTPVPPTNTPVPPTNTPVPPTSTAVPPTNTPVPPTSTAVPPTNTPVPPTKAPPTSTPVPPTKVPPTSTPVPPTKAPPTSTPVPPTKAPPTSTPVPPTKAPVPPTNTPVVTIVKSAASPTLAPPRPATPPPTAGPQRPTPRPGIQNGDICDRNQEYYEKAREFVEKRQFELALEMAQQVQESPKCQFTFVQAQGLISRVQVFDLKGFDRGIQAAKRGLAVDPRQTALWFTQGYAQYMVDSYQEAIGSFQEVLRHYHVNPVTVDILIRTRYMLADAADRRAMKDLQGGCTSRSQELLQAGINAWQEFEDFCNDADCDKSQLQHGENRVKDLRQQLTLCQMQK